MTNLFVEFQYASDITQLSIHFDVGSAFPGPMKLMLNGLEGWNYMNDRINKTYEFKNHHQTLAFVNALAWISHREDHHPDISVGYNTCNVTYTTHAINGLSENDFICAAKVDHLFDL